MGGSPYKQATPTGFGEQADSGQPYVSTGKDVGNDKGFSQGFLEQIAQSDPAAEPVVIWDRAGFHPTEAEEKLPERLPLLPCRRTVQNSTRWKDYGIR